MDNTKELEVLVKYMSEDERRALFRALLRKEKLDAEKSRAEIELLKQQTATEKRNGSWWSRNGVYVVTGAGSLAEIWVMYTLTANGFMLPGWMKNLSLRFTRNLRK